MQIKHAARPIETAAKQPLATRLLQAQRKSVDMQWEIAIKPSHHAQSVQFFAVPF
jgi:hypothetical protein